MSCVAVALVLAVAVAVGSHAVGTPDQTGCLKQDEDCPQSTRPGIEPNQNREKRSPDTEKGNGEALVVDLETDFPCKEATKTILRWRSDQTKIYGVDEHDRYLVKVYLVTSEDGGQMTKISDHYSDPRVRAVMFTGLKPNSTYKFGIHLRTDKNNKPIEIVTKDPFHTLSEDHLSLSTVSYSNVSDCMSYGGEEVRTNFTWTPVPENVCMYEIVVFNRNGSLYGDFIPMHIFTRAQDYTKIEIPELHYDCFMSVAVYATNPVTEGKKHWIDFKTPHCVEFHNWDYNICKPKKPENLTMSAENCQLTLTWKALEHPPPKTRIVIVPSNPYRSNYTQNDTIEGVYPEYITPTEQMGEYMDVYVQAVSRAGGSPIAHGGVENHCPPHHLPMSARLPKFTETGATPAQNQHNVEHTVLVVLVTLMVVVIFGVLSFIGYKAYREWKPVENPVQHEYELHQPLAGASAKETDGEQSPDDSSESDEFEVSRQNLNIGEVIGEGVAQQELGEGGLQQE